MQKIMSRLVLAGLVLAFLAQSRPAGKTSIAIYQIKAAGSADKASASAVTALLGSELTPSSRLEVIEEALLKTVMERQAMNVSDACDDTSCQVEIGKLVKAQKIITGDLVKLGSTYILSLKLLNVQTGAMEFSTKDQCTCTEDQLLQLVAVAGAKVRNHFGDSVPIPGLPVNQVALGARVTAPAQPSAMPQTSAPQTFQEFHPPGTKGGPMVYVSDFKFYIDKYEVTNKDYQECVAAKECNEIQQIVGCTAPDQPVVGVLLSHARNFCKWAGKRLPTSVEWTNAAASTDGRNYPWGNQPPDCNLANFNGCRVGKPLAVGSKPAGASPYGALDMAGNVWEYEATGYVRGGSWYEGPNYMVVGSWGFYGTFSRGFGRMVYGNVGNVGFRCARDENAQ